MANPTSNKDRRNQERMAAADAARNDPEAIVDEDFDIESVFTDEQVGLPPYWNPEVGRKFKATVVGIDDKDPNFNRFILRASHGIRCQRGPAEDAETLLVKAGQYFTCSLYAALPLQRFIGFEVIVICVKLREGVTKDGFDVWEFRVLTDEETKAQLAERRAIQQVDSRM